MRRIQMRGQSRKHLTDQYLVPERPSELHRGEDEPGRRERQRESGRPRPQPPVSDRFAAGRADEKRAREKHHRQEQNSNELRHEAQGKEQGHRERVTPVRPGIWRSRPPEVVIHAAAVRQEQRRFHVVPAKPVIEQQRRIRKAHQDGDCSADWPGHAAADRKNVEERDTTEERIPESQRELVEGEHAQPNRGGHNPEFQRRLFDERNVLVQAAPGHEPVAGFQDAIDAEGMCRFVADKIGVAETDEERKAEQRQNQPEPDPATHYPLMQVMSDQILGTFTFSIESGFRSICARKAVKSRSDLKPMCTVSGEMSRSKDARIGLALRKWFRKMTRPPPRRTRPISPGTAIGSGTTLMRYGA